MTQNLVSVDGNCYVNYGLHTGKTVFLGSAVVRAGAMIYGDVTIGDGFHCGHNAVIREMNAFGDNVSIGSNTSIEPGCAIGRGTRIHGNCFVVRADIGQGVFVGPGVVFTDDPHPACPHYLDCAPPIEIGDYAVIGAGVVIMPGIKIGAGAVIGAGSLVTKDVPANEVWAGHPAVKKKNRSDVVCHKDLHKPFSNKGDLA